MLVLSFEGALISWNWQFAQPVLKFYQAGMLGYLGLSYSVAYFLGLKVIHITWDAAI